MYKKILVPLDGSELAECVLPHVESFISGCQVGTIVFARVIEPQQFTSRGTYAPSEMDLQKVEQNFKMLEEERKETAGAYLSGIAKRFARPGVNVKTAVLVGRPADKLIDYTETNDVELILIATHGRSGVSRWVRGSIADRILRAASIPVLMVRAPGTVSDKKQ